MPKLLQSSEVGSNCKILSYRRRSFNILQQSLNILERDLAGTPAIFNCFQAASPFDQRTICVFFKTIHVRQSKQYPARANDTADNRCRFPTAEVNMFARFIG